MTKSFSLSGASAHDLRSLGRSIKTARVRRGLTQAVVAARCGISRETIRKVESGDPGVAIGTLVEMLWIYGLQSQWVSAVNPDRDQVGKALALDQERQRGRSVDLDNDF